MKVLRFATPELLARAAADQLAAIVHATASTCHVALSGGSTPKRLFDVLAQRGKSFLPWNRVELWWSDERCVPPDHPDSNYGMANAHLITPLGLDPARIHRMAGERDPDHAAADYEALMIERLGTAPALDLDFLGMGPDGHCASLHPGSPGLVETKRWVIANRVDSPLTNGKAVRLTLTPPALNAAKHTRFLVAGADKAPTLAKVVKGPKGMFPAQLVQGGDVAWLVDDAAAAQLVSGPGAGPRGALVILAGDIGGTKTNLALCDDSGAPTREATFAAAEFDSLEAVVAKFLGTSDRVRAACFGVAGPVVDGAAKITNLPWSMSERALGDRLGGARVTLINDLQATALGALVIPPAAFAVLQVGTVPPRATIAVIAPGTGLGEATLVAEVGDDARYRALPSEGGHADFAPTSDEEIELLRFLRGRYGAHVSNERVLSGNGIGDLYDFARQSAGAAAPALDIASGGDRNAAISDAGLAGSDPAAVHALDLFAQILGAEAGNLALRGLATGGVVIGGGIPPKILPRLQTGALIERFAAKGRFATWMRALSVRVVLDPKAALLGAAHCAATTKDQR